MTEAGAANRAAWIIPPEALAEWLTLSRAVDALGPVIPCRAGDPDAWWPDRKDVDSPATHGAVAAAGLGRRACPTRWRPVLSRGGSQWEVPRTDRDEVRSRWPRAMIGLIRTGHRSQDGSTDMTMSGYHARPCDTAAEWDRLLRLVEHPHLVQSWAYGEAKRGEGWVPRRLVIERSGQPAAIAQVLDKRVLGLRGGSRVSRGPMLIEGPGAHQLTAVYRALRTGVRARPGGPLLIAPALAEVNASHRVMRSAGFRRRRPRGWSSSRVDLQRPAEELRSNLAEKWRGALRASERKGLSFVVGRAADDIEWIIARHKENMQVKGFQSPSTRFLRALSHHAEGDFIVCRVRVEDRAVAGLGAVLFGNTAEYYVGWFSDEGRKLRAGNFLLWNLMLEMQRRGMRFLDLGGYSATQECGYDAFKGGIRGTDYQLAGEWWSL